MEDKNESEKLMEELKRIGEGFNKFIESIGEALNKLFYPKEDEWEMKCPFEDGDVYYIITTSGLVNRYSWDNDSFENMDFKQGNVFPTEEAADLEANRRDLLTRFRSFRDECNDNWKPISGKECKTSKFLIGYSWDSKDEQYKLKSLELGSSDLFHQFGYFKNQEDCKRAIDLFGDEIKELFVEKRLANENN